MQPDIAAVMTALENWHLMRDKSVYINGNGFALHPGFCADRFVFIFALTVVEGMTFARYEDKNEFGKTLNELRNKFGNRGDRAK